VEELLKLPSGTLRDIRVGHAEVTFKVVPNDKNYNAIDIVKSIGKSIDNSHVMLASYINTKF